MSDDKGCVLHWFRNDLRLADNPAFTAAATKAADDERPLLCCFVICPNQWQQHDAAPIKLDFLRRSLIELASALEKLGKPLFLLTADDFTTVPKVLEDFVEAVDARALYFNEEYAVNEHRRDQAVAKRLKPLIECVHSYRDQSILPVKSIRTNAGEPYKVFTPYKRSWLEVADTSPISLWPKPSKSRNPDKKLISAAAELSVRADTAKAIDSAFSKLDLIDSSDWAAGEDAAHDELEAFIESYAEDYDRLRDRPAEDGTSRISRFLANGTLSGRQCYVVATEARRRLKSGGASEDAVKGISTWISELIWRDFYIHLMTDNPRLSMHQPFKTETDKLKWNDDEAGFEAWCEGRTGIPLVDAAMKQLNQTGWMHNRLRMVTAMFLTKNLFLDWRRGEQYFMQKLIDGYLPSNNGGWQWSASTGTDAAPYFRVFNPVSQSRSHDPDGAFIRKYLPELASLDNKSIHEPDKNQRKDCGYPEAIVDLKATRASAIERFKALG
ncbi:deoxyribodipyrimidine photo-lyase [Allohahella marinimesophila]|uniref:Deoxyribodipyrimidine photo-lyase n=1 Tax=Allohahella marinimesophila TaxID=1054972 RepID=A0ABP7Q4H7_9GAMM